LLLVLTQVGLKDQLFSRSKPMLGDLFPYPYGTDVTDEFAAVKKLIWRHWLQALTSAIELRSGQNLTMDTVIGVQPPNDLGTDGVGRPGQAASLQHAVRQCGWHRQGASSV
jgi:hypothetical protein